jgi:hypothetical protein
MTKSKRIPSVARNDKAGNIKKMSEDDCYSVSSRYKAANLDTKWSLCCLRKIQMVVSILMEIAFGPRDQFRLRAVYLSPDLLQLV